MTWNAFHHRGDILRAVVENADERRDGILPMQLPGVAENFENELDLVSALVLKWHARLSGNIEQAMTREPMDLPGAVASAWRQTAEQMPGVRMIIDRGLDSPQGSEIQEALVRARELEWVRLAMAAGLANHSSPAAAEAGHRVELAARTGLDQTAPEVAMPPTVLDAHHEANESLVDRIKAVLAA